MTNTPNNQPEEEDETDALLKRFPAAPHISHDVPAPPKIKVDLPPHPNRPKLGAANKSDVRSSALAYQAASSFIMPIILFGLLGWFLEGRFHKNGLIMVTCFILGFVVGVVGLLNVVKKMNE